MSWVFNSKREKGYTDIFIGKLKIARIVFIKRGDSWNCVLETLGELGAVHPTFSDALSSLHEQLNAVAPSENTVP